MRMFYLMKHLLQGSVVYMVKWVKNYQDIISRNISLLTIIHIKHLILNMEI